MRVEFYHLKYEEKYDRENFDDKFWCAFWRHKYHELRKMINSFETRHKKFCLLCIIGEWGMKKYWTILNVYRVYLIVCINNYHK